jgi:rubredoxin
MDPKGNPKRVIEEPGKLTLQIRKLVVGKPSQSDFTRWSCGECGAVHDEERGPNLSDQDLKPRKLKAKWSVEKSEGLKAFFVE